MPLVPKTPKAKTRRSGFKASFRRGKKSDVKKLDEKESSVGMKSSHRRRKKTKPRKVKTGGKNVRKGTKA